MACLTPGAGSLSNDAYQTSCPNVEAIVLAAVEEAVANDPRMPASLLRLHFHDCFVNGCDASVLLDETLGFQGEKSAAPNANSLRGFEVIDAIKSQLESACPQTVSCADILAIAARDSVVLSGGPTWEVLMGRKDSFFANKALATASLPAPNSDLPTLLRKFHDVGLSTKDMVALSGGHTIGKARCSTFSSRLMAAGSSDSSSSTSTTGGGINVDTAFLASLRQLCSNNPDSNSSSSTSTAVAELDFTTPTTFDNQYYVNLLSGDGLLASDHALVAHDGSSDVRSLVELYAQDLEAFFEDFMESMLKMGSLKPLIGNRGQIRRNCRAVNH
ncbi:hypothetical protein ACLOJK_035382 [Asimina triloba]